MIRPVLILSSSATLGLAVSACTTLAPHEVSGRAIYADYCLACHGDGGKGDGPAASGLAKRPADLTGISARNHGTFPMTRVMSTIDGYTRRSDAGSKMPEMGPFLQDGGTVILQGADGSQTPTPLRLVALARYIESLQKP